MSAISDQWTGNGLSDGTAITAGNVTTAGNFTGSAGTWSRPSPAGSPTQVTDGDGQKITSSTGTDVSRIDYALTTSATSMRLQVVFKSPAATANITEMMIIRNVTPATNSHLRYDGTTRTFFARDFANTADLGTSPAIAADDEILIDYVAALHTSPTSSNGRIFFRLINKTNPSWNTTGEHFYDSGYTRNMGTVNYGGARWGKCGGSTGTMSSGCTWEFLGVEGITVNTADTSEAAAKAYFADDPDPGAPQPVAVPMFFRPTQAGQLWR